MRPESSVSSPTSTPCATRARSPKWYSASRFQRASGHTLRTIESLENSLPLIEAAGWEHGYTQTLGNPYISGARAEMTRKGMDAKADVMFYIDYDVSWEPQDLIKVLETEGDVVAGTYRCKTDDRDEVLYMGAIYNDLETNQPIGRLSDGAIKAKVVPAGFLKVTPAPLTSSCGLTLSFAMGRSTRSLSTCFITARTMGLWWGEDYAFSRNYLALGGEIWLVPDVSIDHWQGDYPYTGNFHQFLLRQPGGAKAA
jgi:hypothetical protein